MELVRAPTETEQRLRERRRAVLRQAAVHFLLGVLLLQLFLCTVAVLIRLVDSDEELVDIMPFWSPVLPDESKRSFLQAFRYHKTTYYFASVVFCLAMTGLGVIIYYTAKLCAKCCARRGRGDGRQCDCDCCDVFCDSCCWRSDHGGRAVFIYNTGGYRGHTHGGECLCCADCCDLCVNERCCDSCPTFPSGGSFGSGGSSGSGSSNNNNNGLLAVVFLVILAVLVLIGLFFAMAALVAWVQKVVQKYLALKELQVLTGEYIVKDLSELEKQYKGQDLEAQQNLDDIEPSAPPAPTWVPMMPQEVQTNLYRDLQAVYGIETR